MYFITTIGIRKDGTIHDRTIGMYKSYRKAKKRIMQNACDMFEQGYYKYALIVKVKEGIYPAPDYLYKSNKIVYFRYNSWTNEIYPLKNKPLELEEKNYRVYIIG